MSFALDSIAATPVLFNQHGQDNVIRTDINLVVICMLQQLGKIKQMELNKM